MVPSFLTFRVKKCRELTSSILNRLLKDLDAILFDCDGEFFVPYLKKPFRLNAAAYLNIFDFIISIRCIGVLYKGENVIEGTPEVILKLQSMVRRSCGYSDLSYHSTHDALDKYMQIAESLFDSLYLLLAGCTAARFLMPLSVEDLSAHP